MKRLNKKGFSLLELIVVMAVIAALLVLGLNGLFILQKRSRDNLRINKGNEIVTQINEFRKINLRYPNQDEILFEKDKITIEPDLVVNLKGHLSFSASETDNSKTFFYYESIRGGFAFCIILESDKIESLGTVECPEDKIKSLSN